jgi:hypothetical protein
MTRILELIIAVVITIALFLLIGLFLPSHARVERDVELGNPVSQVYDMLNHFKRWNTWQPWYSLDTRAQYQLEGEEYGAGAKISWNSILNKQVGQGSLEIVESEPEALIRMSLDNNWRGQTPKDMAFTLEHNAQTNAVTVKWSIDVEYGWDIMGRYAGLYLNGRQGELMNEGLGRLANIMATIPNVDYSQTEVTLVDVPAADTIYIGEGVPAAPREWDAASEKMELAWVEVEDFIKKNNLQPLGPRVRVINVLGEETNDFNLAVPVAPHTATATGNVRLGNRFGTRAITTEYRGHRVGLNKARDMLKAYAITHGYNFDRDLTGMWEEWIPQSEEEGGFESVTKLYLPIQ